MINRILIRCGGFTLLIICTFIPPTTDSESLCLVFAIIVTVAAVKKVVWVSRSHTQCELGSARYLSLFNLLLLLRFP